MTAFLRLLSISFVLNCVLTAISDDEGELLFVQAIWRHGDRNPLLYGENRHDNNSAELPGQLTATGMAQLLKLGQGMRWRYIEKLQFISPQYNNQEIYVRSTDSDRTLMSATSNMIGFYGKSTKSPTVYGWPKGFFPIPIHTISKRADYISNAFIPCKRRYVLEDAIQESVEFQNLIKETKDFFAQCTKESGQNINIANAVAVMDNFAVMKAHGVKYPAWATYDVLMRIGQILKQAYGMFFGIGITPLNDIKFDVEMPKLRGGPMLWHLIDQMKSKIECVSKSPDPKLRRVCKTMRRLKYYAHSMHDITLMGLAQVLEVKGVLEFGATNSPPYGTAVTLELYQYTPEKWQEINAVNPEWYYDYYIKLYLWFHNEKTKHTNLIDITNRIGSCAKQDALAGRKTKCKLSTLIEGAKLYKPEPSIEALCEDTNIYVSRRPASPQYHFPRDYNDVEE